MTRFVGKETGMGRAILKAALLAAMAVLGAAAWAQGSETRLERGIQAHNQALSGDSSAIELALSLLGPDGWERPAMALGYHGSALTLKAQAAMKDGKALAALSLIDSGAKEMDAAVKSDPGNIELRVLRLENSIALIESSPVDRKPAARDDIAALEAAASSLSPEVAAIVDLDKGRLALKEKRVGEAMAAWRSAVRRAPGSEAASRARVLLARYGD